MFRDRADAGRRLAESLRHLKGQDVVVLALPRGGVVVGCEVARALGCPLDIVISRKLCAPGDSELAVGAIVDGDSPERVVNEALVRSLGIDEAYLSAEAARQLDEIKRREAKYRGGRPPMEISGRVAVLVDDGIATGASMRAAIRGVKRKKPKRIVAAVPVAPPQAAASLRLEADEVVVLEKHEAFMSVGDVLNARRHLDEAETQPGRAERNTVSCATCLRKIPRISTRSRRGSGLIPSIMCCKAAVRRKWPGCCAN